jgi:hypothetical protein
MVEQLEQADLVIDFVHRNRELMRAWHMDFEADTDPASVRPDTDPASGLA